MNTREAGRASVPAAKGRSTGASAPVLLINPNTSRWVTDGLAAHLRRCWREQGAAMPALVTATARFGAAYIASEASYAVAAHATLDAWARTVERRARRDEPPPGPVLIGCFGDPGLFALRSLAAGPVIGLAQAAIDEAAARGRFAIVTGGRAWQPMLERIVRAFGRESSLARIVVIERSGAELAADPPAAHRLLAAACRRAAHGGGVDAVVLGGAAFAGYGDAIADRVPIAVVDSVSAAARALVGRGPTAPPAGTRPSPDRATRGRHAPETAAWRGVDAALARRITQGR